MNAFEKWAVSLIVVGLAAGCILSAQAIEALSAHWDAQVAIEHERLTQQQKQFDATETMQDVKSLSTDRYSIVHEGDYTYLVNKTNGETWRWFRNDAGTPQEEQGWAHLDDYPFGPSTGKSVTIRDTPDSKDLIVPRP